MRQICTCRRYCTIQNKKQAVNNYRCSSINKNMKFSLKLSDDNTKDTRFNPEQEKASNIYIYSYHMRINTTKEP